MPDVPESRLVEEGAIPPDDFHQEIERIHEIADWDVEVPPDVLDRLAGHSAHLLLDPQVLPAAAAALSVGHLVLQGPPGTGKTSLAVALCRAFGATWFPVTAREDWSTFELIGRQELRVDAEGHEEILGVNGYFTESVIRCAGAIVRHFDDPSEPQANWLLIDELNRAHIDKAFGELFTVLGTDDLVPITLPHHRSGNNVLVTPRRFRVIGTINSIDKQFVNSLSMGLRRRFTFVTVDIPPRRPKGENWGNPEPGASLASKEFSVAISAATGRVARRMTATGSISRESADTVVGELATSARLQIEAFFELIEQVRYTPSASQSPHLPVGTAALIDTVELFLARAHMVGLGPPGFSECMDWAASVKLAPLFDADTIIPNELEQFIDSLPAGFREHTRRELRSIVAAGMYFVD